MRALFPPLPPRTKPRSRAVVFVEFALVATMSVMLYRLGHLINAAHPGQIPEYKVKVAPLLPFVLWWFIGSVLFGRSNDKLAVSQLPKWLQWFMLLVMISYVILA